MTQISVNVIAVLLLSMVFGSVGQICLKIGTGKSQLSLTNLLSLKTLTQPFLLLGVGLYALALVTWLLALAQSQLSYLYPFLAAGYILTIFLSATVLHENVTFLRWVGIGVIVIGIILVSRS